MPKVYRKLNESLKRRIGTLNCGHAASQIIMGVNEPQYTPEELEHFRQENEEGVTVDGKHYTKYEATQRQRGLERAARKQKRRILIDEAAGDTEKLQQDQIKLVHIRQEYKRFSDAAGLRMQHERMNTAGFTWKHAKSAEQTYSRLLTEKQLARASDTFQVIPPARDDAIQPQSIYKEMQKSEVGKHAYKLIVDRKIPVEINYTDEVEPDVRGFTMGKSIFIYAKNTQSVRRTTETIIHEATHIELGKANHTQWEEAYCFAQEAKHKKKQLTFADLKHIIKTVKKLYPEYPWR